MRHHGPWPPDRTHGRRRARHVSPRQSGALQRALPLQNPPARARAPPQTSRRPEKNPIPLLLPPLANRLEAPSSRSPPPPGFLRRARTPGGTNP